MSEKSFILSSSLHQCVKTSVILFIVIYKKQSASCPNPQLRATASAQRRGEVLIPLLNHECSLLLFITRATYIFYTELNEYCVFLCNFVKKLSLVKTLPKLR